MGNSLPVQDVFAVAGLWNSTPEWGDVYTMVMVDGHQQIAKVHDRMPLILSHAEQDYWTAGSPEDALALCQTWVGALHVERTDQRWVGCERSGIANIGVVGVTWPVC